MSSIMLDNVWNSAEERDAAIAEHDHPAIDTRNFSRMTKSQLSSSKAIDKTLKQAHKHRSQCLPYSKAGKAQDTLGFHQIKKIKDETSLTANNVLTMKFWNSFQKHAVCLGGGDESSSSNCSVSSGAVSVPVMSLQHAISSMTEREMSVEIQNIVQALGFRATESLSWKEYKNLCSRIFDPLAGAGAGGAVVPNTMSDNLSQSSFLSDNYSRSMSYTSLDKSSVTHDLPSGRAHTSQSYSSLQRKHRGVGSIAPNMTNADVTDFSPLESTLLAPVKKDALCEVLKNEYRKIRKNQLPDEKRRLQDGQPSYLQQTQKQKIAAIKNNSCLIPLKWKQVNEKRAAREAITQNYKNRQNMIQSFKTVVNAQERNAINRDVINKDEEAASKIEDNSMKRYIENEITARNIKTWKMNEVKIRKELRADHRHNMQASVANSQAMIEQEKAFRRFMLNQDNDPSASKTLSLCTSSKFELPEEIAGRLHGAKRLSQFQQAKEDALVAYEKEMSDRIKQYTSSRKEAIRQAEDYGHGVTLNPLRGEEYFSACSAPSTSSNSFPSSQSYSQERRMTHDATPQYFDSASTVSYFDSTRDSCYDSSCPPVFLDPNYDPLAVNKSASSALYNTNKQHSQSMSKVKSKSKSSSKVYTGKGRSTGGGSVANGSDRSHVDNNKDDDVSFTDSIGDDDDDDELSLPPV